MQAEGELIDTIKNDLIDVLYNEYSKTAHPFEEDAIQEAAIFITTKLKIDDVVHLLHPFSNLLKKRESQSFVASIVHNCLKKVYLKEHRQTVIPTTCCIATEDSMYPSLDSEEQEDQDTHSQLREQRQALVQQALSQVAKKTPRHAAMLQQIADGKTIRQYADDNSMEYNAARQLYHRAKKALHRELVALFDKDPLYNFVISGKMSPDLSLSLSERLHVAETPCTGIGLEPSSSNQYSTSLEIDDEDVLHLQSDEDLSSIDHFSDEK